MSAFIRLFLTLFIATAISACSSLSSRSLSQPAIEGQTWVLKTINGERPAGEKRVTLSFQQETNGDGKVSGRAPCNAYFGSYKRQGDTISFGAMASTKKACPAPLMKQEMAYLGLFSRVNKISLQGHALTLKSYHDNGKQMTFIAESAHITGEIFTSEGGFAAYSRLFITLEEDRKDAPALILGEQVIRFEDAQEPPAKFDLIYAPHLLKKEGLYTISAEVRNKYGQRAFASLNTIEADFTKPMVITLFPADY